MNGDTDGAEGAVSQGWLRGARVAWRRTCGLSFGVDRSTAGNSSSTLVEALTSNTEPICCGC
jgi:hypothetical protein